MPPLPERHVDGASARIPSLRSKIRKPFEQIRQAQLPVCVQDCQKPVRRAQPHSASVTRPSGCNQPSVGTPVFVGNSASTEPLAAAA